jgi:hypothetical protein
MPYLHKFTADDIFVNRLNTSPQYEFTLYSGSLYTNNERYGGANKASGSISLYELNVGRELTSSIVVTGENKSNLCYPFTVKDGSLGSFNSITRAEYNSASYGTGLTSSYPLTSSIQRELIAAASLPTTALSSTDDFFSARRRMIALGNTLNRNKLLSPAFAYSSSNVTVAKPLLTGAVNLISIPSIFFDSGIKRGTMELNFYYTGTLMDTARDEYQNGELISTMGNTSGSIVGVALYNEGFILLTSSQAIYSPNHDDYTNDGVQSQASWLNFGAYSGSNSQNYATSSLYTISFNGTNNVPTMTMFAFAQAGDINNSQNPTWVTSSAERVTGFTSGSYIETRYQNIKNTVQSEYCDFDEKFEKQVFISKVGIFDKDKNLIGVAKLANPIQKRETDAFTLKLKIDF